jgi:transposase
LQATESQAKTANLLRIGFEQVHRIMHRAVKIGLSRRTPDERYYYLSIDEKAVHGGHDYISILSDERTGTVIEVMEGRDNEAVDELCQTALSDERRSTVKTVCGDMRQPYIGGIKCRFQNALHCYDPYHSVTYLNKAADKVRKREVRRHEDLHKTNRLFLKDKANFTDERYFKFESVDKSNYEVSRAWRIKENFRDIPTKRISATSALSLFYMWKRDAENANIKEITEVVEMFERHGKGILNAMKTGANNARAERLNGSIRELKTIGRGYGNIENFRIAILFFHGNPDLLPHK